MFVSKRRFDELNKRVDELEKREESLFDKCNSLIVENAKLKATVKQQGLKTKELGRKTISQTTTKKEPTPSVNQIIDEWLNGEGEDNGN